MKSHLITKHKIFLIFFSILSLIVSCATNPVTGRRELMLLSESGEIKLGEKTDAQIAERYGIYDDPDLAAYVERLGRKIAAHSHRSHLSFEFKVLDSPVVNAFAVPGGYIYVTRGILAYFNNEAELAGVIGHEIGHVAARHSAQQYSRAQLAQLGFGLGTILSESFRRYAGLAEFGVGMLFLKFSRDNERQADDLGVEYATKAGFDARHVAGFFATLNRLNPSSAQSGLPGWFSTHPNPTDRTHRVREEARKWIHKLGSTNLDVSRSTYLHHIDGIVFGENPRQGYVADGIFYHPELRLQFPVPANWKLNNAPAQVQMVSKKQDAAILFSLASGSSLQAAAAKFVAEAKAHIIRSDAVMVNGLRARYLLSDIKTQQGPIRIMSYFIGKDEHIFVFHAFTPQAVFERYRWTFSNTIEGFKDLTDPKRLHVKPDRLRIHTTGNSGILKEALRSLDVQDDRLEEMALLNGRHLQDWIPANTLLKVVEKGS